MQIPVGAILEHTATWDRSSVRSVGPGRYEYSGEETSAEYAGGGGGEFELPAALRRLAAEPGNGRRSRQDIEPLARKMTPKMKLSSHLPNFSSGSSHRQHSSNSKLDKTDGTKIRSVDARASAPNVEGSVWKHPKSFNKQDYDGRVGNLRQRMQAEGFWPGDQVLTESILRALEPSN
ncbi:hypothetical protein B0H10DRAFT_1957502 [Mycena sp. CBHHK59/15]|nr:hypothetical protein B0H10DRAFT_1957502 [Mycena sp. CBHHK59/15]